MTNAKLQAAANIIKNSAIEFLATKHGLTVEQVTAEIESGNPRACEQFAKLVVKGIEEAQRLANTGKINFN